MDICVLVEHFGGIALIISQSVLDGFPGLMLLLCFQVLLMQGFGLQTLQISKPSLHPLAEGLFPEDVSPCRHFQGCVFALDRGASGQRAAAGAAPCSLPVPRTRRGLFPGCSPHPARPLVSTAGLHSQQRRFGASKPHPGLV